MNLVCDSLRKQGVTVAPVMQDGKALRLTWNPAQTGPLLEDRVVVVLPDVHLSNDGDGDIFRQNDPFRHARLRLFLTALVHARELVLHQGRRFSTLQLGDFYDVWRGYPEYKDHPTSDYRRIEEHYADVIDLMISGLDMRVCVGNHDASMALFPPFWGRNQFGPNGRLAYSQRLAGGRILAFHGHQVDQLQKAMQSQGGSTVVKAATLAAQKLSNPLSLLIQEGVDLLQDAFDDPHLSEQDLLNAHWPKSTTLSDQGGFQAKLWSDRLHNDHVKRVLEQTPWKDIVRLVFVGHSHRAGISAITLGNTFVPVIDCGSWAWGRTQFCVAIEGEVSLWSLEANEVERS